MKGFVVAVILIGLVVALVMPASPPVATAVVAAPAAADRAPPPPPPAQTMAGFDTLIDRDASGHFIATATVNNASVQFVVDTGADLVALTTADAERAGVAFDPARFHVIGRGASGDVRGEEVRIADIVLDGKRATDVRAVVLEGGSMSLLGHSYLRQLNAVEISADTMRLR